MIPLSLITGTTLQHEVSGVFDFQAQPGTRSRRPEQDNRNHAKDRYYNLDSR
jgi:hypothetical protein